jgi:hypothetical protein
MRALGADYPSVDVQKSWVRGGGIAGHSSDGDWRLHNQKE